MMIIIEYLKASDTRPLDHSLQQVIVNGELFRGCNCKQKLKGGRRGGVDQGEPLYICLPFQLTVSDIQPIITIFPDPAPTSPTSASPPTPAAVVNP